MSDFEQMLARLTPEVYDRFKTAVELGKWPDGRTLSDEQKSLCIQAIIAYEHTHVPAHERTGYMPPKPGACGTPPQDESTTPLKWR